MGANEAGRTEAAPSAITSTTVTARVVDVAVGHGTGATRVGGRTVAAEAVLHVVADAAVQTRVTGAFIHVRLTELT